MEVRKTEKIYLNLAERDTLLKAREIVRDICQSTEESPDIDDICRDIEGNIDNLLEEVEVE